MTLQNPDAPVIVARGLSKCYQIYQNPADRLKQALWRGRRQYFKPFWPLRDVSFSVRHREVVGIVGANGSGKSTLLQLIAGILQPTAGELTVTGRVAALLELGSGFNPEFTGHDNLYMNAALLGLTREEAEARYDDIVAFADIGDFIHQPVKTYSSGMVVRLAFAITSFVDADLLIVDEALSVGDVAFQARCLERMERLMDSGTTVLLVTHDIQMIRRYCHRVLYLNQGQLCYDGDPEEGTEIYLRDVKERNNHGELRTQRWQNDDGRSGIGVASDHGRITDVRWLNARGSASSALISQGERCCFRVEAWVDAAVRSPRVQMTVRDHRGYNLYGYSNRFAGRELHADAEGKLWVDYAFDARLQLGQYTVTVRLDDNPGNHDVQLLDKQVAVLDFEVTASQRNFDAVIDLSGSCDAHA